MVIKQLFTGDIKRDIPPRIPDTQHKRFRSVN